jgi:hypothetical protein
MNLIDNVYFVFSFGRTVFHFLTDLTDIVHAIVGRRIDLDHIHGTARRNRFTGRTFPTRAAIHRMLTVDCFCKNFCDRRFTGSSCSAK